MRRAVDEAISSRTTRSFSRRVLLVEHVLANDPDVRGPVLDKDGHVGGPADYELGPLGPVEQPPPVLPQDPDGHPGRPQSQERVLEDGPLRDSHPQAPHASTRPATASGTKISGSPPSAVAGLMPSPPGGPPH